MGLAGSTASRASKSPGRRRKLGRATFHTPGKGFVRKEVKAQHYKAQQYESPFEL